ncbi:MAG TPA: DUF4058 family protein [Planctomycetaceae bacterium]|nr:DUF4058 family protein [Planctomycetaceae bacterium]
MRSPFPGMDPYLEVTAIWPDFHDAFAGEIRNLLNQKLPAPFYARLEMRPEIGIVGEEAGGISIVPDVSVVESWRPGDQRTAAATLQEPRTEISKSIDVTVFREPLRHHFVEVRDAGHKLVTLIEILSPSNKRRGVDRENYENKQREVLDSDVNLIEIDLLRTGERMLGDVNVAELVSRLQPAPDYLVLVSRASLRHGAGLGYHVFPVAIRDALPCIPVPLRTGTDDVPLDLQYVFDRAYEGGPYRRGAVNYSLPPESALRDADVAWADELLRRAHVAPAS